MIYGAQTFKNHQEIDRREESQFACFGIRVSTVKFDPGRAAPGTPHFPALPLFQGARHE